MTLNKILLEGKTKRSYTKSHTVVCTNVMSRNGERRKINEKIASLHFPFSLPLLPIRATAAGLDTMDTNGTAFESLWLTIIIRVRPY